MIDFTGGHAQNRTGIKGFAILCVTIPPRGQLGLQGSKLFVDCEYAMGSNILIPFNEFSTPMLTNWGCPPKRMVN